MSEQNIFEQASRKQLRIETPQGRISVEDLWTLPLTSATKPLTLDNLARALNAELKSLTEEDSFVPQPDKKTSAKRALLQLQFDIVKHVIGVLVVERDAKAAAQERAEKKQRLLGLLAQKDAEAESQMTREEILAQIEAL